MGEQHGLSQNGTDSNFKFTDEIGDWLPSPQLPERFWTISNANVPYTIATHIGMISVFDKAAKPTTPIYAIDTNFPLSNHEFLLRLKSPLLNHIPYVVQYQRVYNIPRALRAAFGPPETEKWTILEPIPHSIAGAHLVICPVQTSLLDVVSYHSYSVPIYYTLEPCLLNLRIRQDSRLQLVCASDNADSYEPTYITSLRAKGSRGLTLDLKYEILELEIDYLDDGDPEKYMWLCIPPPYVFDDVVMIVEPFAGNMTRHEDVMEKWKVFLLSAQPDWVETPEVKEQRSSAVWALMMWYLLRRRQQHI